ncbi:M15 family metallopeptidase [Solicola sp. PLA-1-18]|uniref:M15 family metallopeptidase n=1 Tax=Solicola sp. PLA-1-18 TaxID=3380532 RepID=UPI003B76EF9F
MRRLLPLVAATVLLAACSAGTPDAPQPERATVTPSATPAATPTPTPTPSPSPEPGTVAPAWLGTRVLPVDADGVATARPTPPELRQRRFTLPDSVEGLPGTGFASRVVTPAPRAVLDRSTWTSSCPVGRGDLSWVRVTFRGFDGSRRTGELLVATTVADDVVRVFARLWRADFPIEQMRVTTRAELDAPPTGDGNNTGAFVCRAVTGGSTFSQHAYGTAIDVNPFQNPYEKGEVVVPELASSYLDRTPRPGVVTADGAVVRAFAAVGWEWGGAWRSLKDYQHFSLNGR